LKQCRSFVFVAAKWKKANHVFLWLKMTTKNVRIEPLFWLTLLVRQSGLAKLLGPSGMVMAVM
jgi:hypothetical protein